MTENGYVVLFTEYDEREELPREHLRYYAAEDDSCAGDDEGYFVEEVVEGAELLGRKSDDGQYHNVMVEEVTEAGYKVLFTEFGDDEQNRAELPIEHLRYPYAADEGATRRRRATTRRTATTTIVMTRPSPRARS